MKLLNCSICRHRGKATISAETNEGVLYGRRAYKLILGHGDGHALLVAEYYKRLLADRREANKHNREIEKVKKWSTKKQLNWLMDRQRK
jgi:hypothetical protein